MDGFGDRRSDAALLQAHAAGDRTAFTELFTRHRPRLYALARRRSVTPEDAADTLQEAMLCAHRAAGSFRHDAAVSSWLHRIVVNVSIDRARRAVAAAEAARAHAVIAGASAVAGDRSGQVDTALTVRQALLSLPADQRAAVLAVDMHGYSIADAAALLDIAEGTVKSRRARARARLAVLLRPAA